MATLVMVGDWFTVSLKSWLVLPAALVAVMVRLATPPVPAAGVPLMRPVVALRVRPLGRVPVVTE